VTSVYRFARSFPPLSSRFYFLDLRSVDLLLLRRLTFPVSRCTLRSLFVQSQLMFVSGSGNAPVPPDLWSRLCVGRRQIFPPSYLDVFGPSSSSLCRLWALWVERRQISTKYQRRCSSFPPALTSSVRHGLVPGSPSRFRLRSQRMWSLSLSLCWAPPDLSPLLP
jgi:hypothetical protein